MPLYEYKCPCGRLWEARHTIDERDDEICPVCFQQPVRVLSLPGKPVVYEYYSENLGAVVTGPKQKAQLIKERNLTEVG
jgi:putative FmdB family regulatory protein